jgi:hypothetical protein
MSTWIKTYYDFGMPIATFRIGERSLMASPIMAALIEAKQNPEKLEKALYDFIVNRRPDLAGCSIVSIDQQGGPRLFNVMVTHPSLPKIGPIAYPPVLYLERCAICHGNIEEHYRVDSFVSRQVWITSDPNAKGAYTATVCSQECLDKILAQEAKYHALGRPDLEDSNYDSNE